MANYSFSDCLQNSYKVNWRIGDVLANRQFDSGSRWLPARLSGADGVAFLSDSERTKLNQVEMAAYAHLFGFVEEFIAPKMLSLASGHELQDREAFDALVNFAAEEVKHMNLFREVRTRVDGALGFELKLLEGERNVARAVLDKNTGAVLLLTAAIEWFTQLHYVEAFKDDASVDPLTKSIFKAHWQEESQHARMDHLETLRVFAAMRPVEKDAAIADLIDLVAAVDGLLRTQTRYDVENLERCLDRTFDSPQTEALFRSILRAKRYCFIESGVTHPNFQALFTEVTTPEQREKVGKALATLLQEAPAA
jgi:para-aminobenzoate N-oxygenase AurF